MVLPPLPGNTCLINKLQGKEKLEIFDGIILCEEVSSVKKHIGSVYEVEQISPVTECDIG